MRGDKHGRVALLDMKLDEEGVSRDREKSGRLGGQFQVAFKRWEKAQWWRARRKERRAA